MVIGDVQRKGIMMQEQGNDDDDDRHGDDASYGTCMLMMTDVNAIHASIRYDNSTVST